MMKLETSKWVQYGVCIGLGGWNGGGNFRRTLNRNINFEPKIN